MKSTMTEPEREFWIREHEGSPGVGMAAPYERIFTSDPVRYLRDHRPDWEVFATDDGAIACDPDAGRDYERIIELLEI